jgi:hypothetical protein
MRRDRRDRDVAAAFLLDMSASTDSEVPEEAEPSAQPPPREYDYVGIYDEDPFWGSTRSGKPPRRRRVIDVEKEALLLIEALDGGTRRHGFSGYGREQVEFCVIRTSARTAINGLGRIAAISPSARRAWVVSAMRHGSSAPGRRAARAARPRRLPQDWTTAVTAQPGLRHPGQ